MSELIEQLKQAWSNFDSAALDQLEPMYAPDVVFIEPAGKIAGREALFEHFRGSLSDLIECRFQFDPGLEVIVEGKAYLAWSMTFRHSRLRGGDQIIINGVSLLLFDHRITFHQDWFDLGATVYEHIPVLGAAVRFVKNRMHSH